MLAELEERMKMWDTDPRIGDIILNRAPYLKIYSEYISRFDKALKTLEEATRKNPNFARALREFEAQPSCAQLPLAGYMLETVQRIPRYKLLLTDYVKHLPENSPDRTPSEKALDIISSVATHVNETIRQMVS
jgi:FYVE/RhoGEF/PH domain-containing protein 5/6